MLPPCCGMALPVSWPGVLSDRFCRSETGVFSESCTGFTIPISKCFAISAPFRKRRSGSRVPFLALDDPRPLICSCRGPVDLHRSRMGNPPGPHPRLNAGSASVAPLPRAAVGCVRPVDDLADDLEAVFPNRLGLRCPFPFPFPRPRSGTRSCQKASATPWRFEIRMTAVALQPAPLKNSLAA